MKTIKDYIVKGVPMVVNDMGEKRYTREGSIIFPNGWVASIVRPISTPEKYSIAICDYNGYFNWNTLDKYYTTDRGTVVCDTEEEVCNVLEYIKNL